MKIPEYDQRVSLSSPGPAPTISGDAAAAPWLGLAKVGAETMELGKVIQDRQDEISRTKEITDRSIDAETRITDLKIAIANERDPQTATQKFSEGMAGIKNDVMDGANDYKVVNAMTNHLANREVTGISEVKHETYKWSLEDDALTRAKRKDLIVMESQADSGKFLESKDALARLYQAGVDMKTLSPISAYEQNEKAQKELLRQTVAGITERDPLNAPRLVEPFLTNIDATEAYYLRHGAVMAQALANTNANKADKKRWEKNLVPFREEVRAGRMTEKEVFRAARNNAIGHDEVSRLLADIDSRDTRRTTDNNRVSHQRASAIVNDVTMGRLGAAEGAAKIDRDPGVLPEHKAQATALLTRADAEKIPTLVTKAIALEQAATIIRNPTQKKAADSEIALRRTQEYLDNPETYKKDPMKFYKKVLDEIGGGTDDGIPLSPYDAVTLPKAFKYYVLEKRGGAISTPREYWIKWYKQRSLGAPPFPR
jgi:hypothetical protein